MEINKVSEIMNLVTDLTIKLVLVVGIILISLYAIDISQQSLLAVQEMTNKIDMMFVKS